MRSDLVPYPISRLFDLTFFAPPTPFNHHHSKKTLEALKPGCPPCTVKRNGFYVTGETSAVRTLCQSGEWAQAKQTMEDNLLTDRFKATAAYANWWATATVDRYRSEGVPPALKRGAPKDKEPSTDTPPLSKASKRTADGKSKSKELTLMDVVALVMANNGVFSNDGCVVIKFNGATVFSGDMPATPEELKALHGDITSLVNLKSRFGSIKRDLSSANASMAAFIEANAERMELMGMPKASLLNDAEAARADAELFKQRAAAMEATADSQRAEATRLRKALAAARGELETLKETTRKREAKSSSESSSDRGAGSAPAAAADAPSDGGGAELPPQARIAELHAALQASDSQRAQLAASHEGAQAHAAALAAELERTKREAASCNAALTQQLAAQQARIAELERANRDATHGARNAAAAAAATVHIKRECVESAEAAAAGAVAAAADANAAAAVAQGAAAAASKALEEATECAVCLDRARDTRFFDCSHRLCAVCGPQTAKCPLCRSSKKLRKPQRVD